MRKLGDIFQDKGGQCRGNTNLIFILRTTSSHHDIALPGFESEGEEEPQSLSVDISVTAELE